MASIHVWRSIEVAASKGGFAGDPTTLPLWELSKRELVEIAMRLTMAENVADAMKQVLDEKSALEANGII